MEAIELDRIGDGNEQEQSHSAQVGGSFFVGDAKVGIICEDRIVLSDIYFFRFAKRHGPFAKRKNAAHASHTSNSTPTT
jgi:hypothetical protein